MIIIIIIKKLTIVISLNACVIVSRQNFHNKKYFVSISEWFNVIAGQKKKSMDKCMYK